MSTAAAAAAPAPEAVAAPPKSKKKLIVIGAIVAAIAAGGAGAFFFLKKPHEGEKSGAEAPKAKKSPAFIPFDTMVVNLHDEGAEKMMQIGFSFEAADSKAADAVKTHTPAIRNRLILLLTSKTSQDIAGREGKEKLAAEILDEARQAMGATKEAPIIEAVHFSSLIVQ
jgi:flagellar FliL protein